MPILNFDLLHVRGLASATLKFFPFLHADNEETLNILPAEKCAYTVVEDNGFSFVFLSSDPSLTPHHLIPVFQALTGDWEKISGYTVVPEARAQLFRERFSACDQLCSEAGKYYALYYEDPNWKELSLWLYKAGETEALQIARPHIQTVAGSYVYTCLHVLLVFHVADVGIMCACLSSHHSRTYIGICYNCHVHVCKCSSLTMHARKKSLVYTVCARA